MFKNFCQNHLRFDSINRFYFFDLRKIPKVKKIILLFNSEYFNILSVNLLLLRIICKQHVNIKLKSGKPFFVRIVLKNKLMEKLFKILTNSYFPFTNKSNRFSVNLFFVKNYTLFYKFNQFFKIVGGFDKITILVVICNYNFKQINYINKNFKTFTS